MAKGVRRGSYGVEDDSAPTRTRQTICGIALARALQVLQVHPQAEARKMPAMVKGVPVLELRSVLTPSLSGFECDMVGLPFQRGPAGSKTACRVRVARLGSGKLYDAPLQKALVAVCSFWQMTAFLRAFGSFAALGTSPKSVCYKLRSSCEDSASFLPFALIKSFASPSSLRIWVCSFALRFRSQKTSQLHVEMTGTIKASYFP